MVGGGEHLAQFGPGDGAAHGDVDVRGQPPLWFDGGEVLHVVAEEPAQVLDEPVEQRREVQRIARRPLVVVGVRVGRGAVALDPAVARAGQGEEHRRPERLAVRRGVGLADRARGDLAPGQVRGILPPPGRPVTADRLGGQHVAAHPGAGDLLVQLADAARHRRVPPVGLVVVSLGLGAQLDPQALFVVGLVGLDDGLAGRGASPPGTAPPAGSWLRSAQDGQTVARVCPHGTSTGSVWPVWRSVRRSWTGRTHPPWLTASSRTTLRASGMASRCALVVGWVIRPPSRRGRRGRWRASGCGSRSRGTPGSGTRRWCWCRAAGRRSRGSPRETATR